MHSLLQTTENTRDLGGYRTRSGKVTAPLCLLRSDIPFAPSEKDIAFLRENGITTIVDLRDATALQRVPCGFRDIPGFTYRNFPIEEGASIPPTMEEVLPSYIAIAESRGLHDAMACIAKAPSGVLFHCTAGKDRTGILAAFILLLCDVPEADVVEDYVLTQAYSPKRIARLRERFPQIDPRIMDASREHILPLLAHFLHEYQDIREALLAHGHTPETLDGIRNKLLH